LDPEHRGAGEETPSDGDVLTREGAIDENAHMQGVWFGTKIRIEATIDRELYHQIQRIIESERRAAQSRDWPEVPISNVVEMILRKGVRSYLLEKRPAETSTR
jgi:hypothetical protein